MPNRMLFLIAAFLLLAPPVASAETVGIPPATWTTPNGRCFSGGLEFPARGNVCFMEDRILGKPISIPEK